MLFLKTNIQQSLLAKALVLLIIVINMSSTIPQFKNVPTLPKVNPLFFQHGRNHELPKVEIESELITRRNSTTWILDISQNTTEDNPKSKIVIIVTGTFPFHVYMKKRTAEQSNNTEWTSKRYVYDHDIFNISSYKFEMKWTLHWSFIKATNSLFEFRSTISPFFGISVSYSLGLQKKTVKIETSTSISPPFKDYFGIIQNKTQNASCGAHFHIFPRHPSTSGRDILSGFTCKFANGILGQVEKKQYYLDQVVTNYVNSGKNCWRKESEGHSGHTFYPSSSMLAMCKSYDMLKDKFGSTPVFASLYNPKRNINPEYFYAKEDVKDSAMIHIKPIDVYHHVGDKIEVICTISKAYAATPVHFGIKHENNDSIMFFPSLDNARILDTKYEDMQSKLQIILDNVNIKSIFCFAPVRGSYDWINASVSVSVYEFSRPKFTGTKHSFLLDDQVVERSFEIGSKMKSISCGAIGFPPPKISWTRNSSPLESTEEGTFHSLERRSVIYFKLIDKATEGIYTCKAQNSQGEAQMLYNVVVKDNSATILAVSITIPVFGIILIFLFIILFTWKKIKQRRLSITFLSEHEQQQFINGSHGKCLRGPNAYILSQPFEPKYMISRGCLKFDGRHILGYGEYGMVLDGWMCADQSVLLRAAIKTTKQITNVMHFKALLSEVKISSYLTGHPNIVEFFGACIENIMNGEIYAAYEFCEQGDLLTVLRRMSQFKHSNLKVNDEFGSKEVFDLKLKISCTGNLFEWARDIANGMVYLSSRNVVHGDLAARNILITKNNVARISDFGLSRQLLHDYAVYLKKTKVSLPWKWMAPESLTESNFSVQSDVWSFGIVLWEIFSLGDSPYAGRKYDEKFIKDIYDGMRLAKPQLASEAIFNMMLRCWEKYPECRPSIASVAVDIEVFTSNIQGKSDTHYAAL